jgi:hypothetical protein
MGRVDSSAVWMLPNTCPFFSPLPWVGDLLVGAEAISSRLVLDGECMTGKRHLLDGYWGEQSFFLKLGPSHWWNFQHGIGTAHRMKWLHLSRCYVLDKPICDPQYRPRCKLPSHVKVLDNKCSQRAWIIDDGAASVGTFVEDILVRRIFC